jgi:hypothetical protein
VIPWFLDKVIKKTHAHRDTDANIPHFYCLVISSLILFAGFMTANIASPELKMIHPMYFGISLAIIIISLWLITTCNCTSFLLCLASNHYVSWICLY